VNIKAIRLGGQEAGRPDRDEIIICAS